MAVRSKPYKVKAFGFSDIGLQRENNEDVWGALHQERFFVLADGMGGHRAGEVAAQETTDRLINAIKNLNRVGSQNVEGMIEKVIQEVNHEVYLESKKDEALRGMGTTLCCVYFHERGLVHAHVGDSRIYRLRGKKLKLLTKDHSLLMEMIDIGEVSEKRAKGVSYKNIITRAVGTSPFVGVTVNSSDVKPGDFFMMCSDGLSDLVSQKEIEAIMNQSEDVQNMVKALVGAALDAGGCDNVTVVAMRVVGEDDLS